MYSGPPHRTTAATDTRADLLTSADSLLLDASRNRFAHGFADES
jgi:hypothetical protein